MRRLEFTRPGRNAATLPRNAGEAVTQLAHLARERQRLQQERATLMRRIRRIDTRLRAIAATETRLMPLIHAEVQAKSAGEATTPTRKPVVLPAGMGEVTLRY
jgi:hypothetical protein